MTAVDIAIYSIMLLATGAIPVEEIASLVRAVGYYPTEEEIENMCNEVCKFNLEVCRVFLRK